MTAEDRTPVIVGGARTPFGRFRGGLASVTAVELGAHALRAALDRSGVAAHDVDAVILGEVIQAGSQQGPARQASIAAGIGWGVPTVTINKLCLSGITAVIDAARMIMAGEAQVVLAGGMESMTNAPHLMLGAREPVALGDLTLVDSLTWDGLQDPFDGRVMGAVTDDGNRERGIERMRQDEYALRSHQLAAAASLEAEIAPMTVRTRRGDVTVAADEGIRPDTSLDALAALKPVFRENGTVTAGSSSPLSDGAAALVVMSRAAARAAGLRELSEVVSWGQVAGPDVSLHSQPSRAILRACERAGVDASELDAVEINEAFASVVLQSVDDLGIDPSRVNGQGGAIALGHPIGASGARLALHLALELSRKGGIGAAALCGGGGQGDAIVLRAGASG